MGLLFIDMNMSTDDRSTQNVPFLAGSTRATPQAVICYGHDGGWQRKA
jgi:hypothetical protein